MVFLWLGVLFTELSQNIFRPQCAWFTFLKNFTRNITDARLRFMISFNLLNTQDEPENEANHEHFCRTLSLSVSSFLRNPSLPNNLKRLSDSLLRPVLAWTLAQAGDFTHWSWFAGMLPEYDSLAELLEKEAEWERDATGLRLRMLSILLEIAEEYIAAGKKFFSKPTCLQWPSPFLLDQSSHNRPIRI